MDSLYQGPSSKPLHHLDPDVVLLSRPDTQNSALRVLPCGQTLWDASASPTGWDQGVWKCKESPLKKHEAETGGCFITLVSY